MKFFILLLIVLTPLAHSSSLDAPDDSIKYIQEWADGLQAAVKNGDKPAIKSFFHDHAVFLTCEQLNETERNSPYKAKGYGQDEIVDLFAKPNPKFAIHVISSRYSDKEAWEVGKLAFAFLVITGFRDPIASDEFRFFIKDNKAKYYIGEYLACGWASMNCRKVCE
ncbi:hypothetical protein CAEBREN_23635 [Caenorhabditis brenneri]|uniref:NTF2-like domain-containing protein n=1 Tax=Caenorhabditis brenneri TaxID=135651 RepID=G0N048_CAEBE|nr:hypothetical protein CAEBREN_23635 [Caenorhabditis brenneri]